MAKERADLTAEERALVDILAEKYDRAEMALADIDWAIGGGATPTLAGVRAWWQAWRDSSARRLDELTGREKGGERSTTPG